MNLKLMREINALRSLTVKMLQERYVEVFGEETRSYNKNFLQKRIAWRLQVIEEGDISERARERSRELANDADLRIRPLADGYQSKIDASRFQTTSYPFKPECDKRLPVPGTMLTRPYKGGSVRVMVLKKGFEYNGEIYRSLSAIARTVTGSRWNGFHFFGLKKERAQA